MHTFIYTQKYVFLSFKTLLWRFFKKKCYQSLQEKVKIHSESKADIAKQTLLGINEVGFSSLMQECYTYSF